MNNLLGFKFHDGDHVRIKKDGRLATVIKSYCNMSGWCDEFRVRVQYLDDNTDLGAAWVERDLAADDVEKCGNREEVAK